MTPILVLRAARPASVTSGELFKPVRRAHAGVAAAGKNKNSARKKHLDLGFYEALLLSELSSPLRGCYPA